MIITMIQKNTISFVQRITYRRELNTNVSEEFRYDRVLRVTPLLEKPETNLLYIKELGICVESPITHMNYEIEIEKARCNFSPKYYKLQDFHRRITYRYDWLSVRAASNGVRKVISNKNEMKLKWAELSEYLRKDYIGVGVESYLNKITEEFCHDENLQTSIDNYFYFGLLFPPIPHSHPKEWSCNRRVFMNDFSILNLSETLEFVKEEDSIGGFDKVKHSYFINVPDSAPDTPEHKKEDDYSLYDKKKDNVAVRSSTRIAVQEIHLPIPLKTKMRFKMSDIETAKFNDNIPGMNKKLPFDVPTGKITTMYKEYLEKMFTLKIPIPIDLPADIFASSVISLLGSVIAASAGCISPVSPVLTKQATSVALLGGFIGKAAVYQNTMRKFWDMIKNMTVGSVPEYLFDRFRYIAGLCFDYGELNGNIIKMIDKFQRSEGGIFETEQLNNNLAKNPATNKYRIKINDYISSVLHNSNGDISKLKDNKIYWGTEDEKIHRINLKKNFYISYTWSLDKEGMENVLGGRTIALNDIWATELYLESFDWIDEYLYKLKYRVILWDHFGLDLPDLEKIFNIIPILSWEIFASWFLLQHCYAYRPFLTKATFVEEYVGDVRESISAKVDPRIKKEEERMNEIKKRIHQEKERIIKNRTEIMVKGTKLINSPFYK